MTAEPDVTSLTTVVRVVDRFDDPRPLGDVVGSTSPLGVRRSGADVEARIGIDDHALRIRPLSRPGWGRAGVAYDATPRVAGTMFAAQVLNGHNCSQTFYFPETLRVRIRRILGDLRRGRSPLRPRHHENLAVGWFDSAAPADPLHAGNDFVMHADTHENGELWATVSGRPAPVLRGVDNVPILYAVVLRERGAAYYAGSAANVRGLPVYPALRPLAIDTHAATPAVHGGVHQKILGEVGYREDTRVYGIAVEHLPELASWCGTAHAADRLVGEVLVPGSSAAVGGRWDGSAAGLRRTPTGAHTHAPDTTAVLTPQAPTGLVHIAIDAGSRPGAAGLVWRHGPRGAWRVVVGRDGTRLEIRHADLDWTRVATASARLRRRRTHSLQVVDDGERFTVILDGRRLFDGEVADQRLGDQPGVGVSLAAGTSALRDFEAHPRTVSFASWVDIPAPAIGTGTSVAFDDTFDVTAEDLHGLTTPSGGRPWERTVGPGVIVSTGQGARVRGDVASPNPDRTIYTVPWSDPSYADVDVEMTPPGDDRESGHNCRGGLVFWQDDDNFIVINVWLDPTLDTTSVSTFYHLDGHEDMYDAVWTLTGQRITWGSRFSLRAAFDGKRFVALLDGDAVLHRALVDVYAGTPDLQIRRVGIIANEEWGNDTGTVFHRVVGRTR